MEDLEKVLLLKYINRKYYETENDLIIVKNRMSLRRSHPEDYMYLALELARHEATVRILNDLTIILQNGRP